jgi:DNA-binding FrmR family transcriptional regulator
VVAGEKEKGMTEKMEIHSEIPFAQESDCGRGHLHEHHQGVLNRLARIEGHVRGIKRMVEENKPCPDVLVQIAAVRSALNSVGRIVLEDHLKGCMFEALQTGEFDAAYYALGKSLDQFIR